MNAPDFYHYQPFNERWLRDLLVDNKLYMSNPAGFNDPWDCRPFFNSRQATKPQYRKKLAKYLARLGTKYSSDKPVEETAAKLALIRDDICYAQEIIHNLSQGISQAIARQWRIYCMTPICDSELMWALYGDKHGGVCIGFDGDSDIMRLAEPVRYMRRYPPLDVLDENAPHEVLLIKSQSWAYEHERRLIAWERTHARSAEGLVCDNNTLLLPPSAIKFVIVGALAQKHVERHVLELSEERSEPISVLRAVLSPDQYALTFRKISPRPP